MSTETRTPKYDYGTTGLDVVIHDIRPVYTGEPRRFTVTDIPHVDPDHESQKRVHAAIENPRKENDLGFVFINPADGSDESSGVLNVYHYPWSGHTPNPVGINEMAAFAAANPTDTILAVDSPATGFSDRISPAVAGEIARTGSYMAYGEIAIEALEKVIKDFDMHVFSGASQGARRAIACAALMGMNLKRQTAELHLIDPVGSHEQSMLQLANGFMIRMAGNSGNYVKASTDSIGAEAQKNQDSLGRIRVGLVDLIKRHGFWNQFVQEPRALAKDGLEADLFWAFPFVKDALVVTSPGASELTRPEDAQRILKELSESDDGPKRIEHRVLDDQTHALFAGHPGTLGVLLDRKAFQQK